MTDRIDGMMGRPTIWAVFLASMLLLGGCADQEVDLAVVVHVLPRGDRLPRLVPVQLPDPGRGGDGGIGVTAGQGPQKEVGAASLGDRGEQEVVVSVAVHVPRRGDLAQVVVLIEPDDPGVGVGQEGRAGVDRSEHHVDQPVGAALKLSSPGL